MLKPPLLVCNHDKELRQYCKSLALPRFENIMITSLAFSALMAYYVLGTGDSTVLNSLTDAMHSIAASLKRAFAPYNPYSPSLTCPKPRATAIGCLFTLLHASHHRCTPTVGVIFFTTLASSTFCQLQISFRIFT